MFGEINYRWKRWSSSIVDDWKQEIRRIKIKRLVWRGKAIDIGSKASYPADVLSNLCSNGFRFDGVVCGSMEGFLQSLKRKDLMKQRQICSMKGRNAKNMTTKAWQCEQIVWWKGKAMDRQGDEFQKLIRKAYQAMFEQSERFRMALMSTRGKALFHVLGKSDTFETILTEQEFCTILTELRDGYDWRDKSQELISKSIRRPKVMYLHGFGSSAASGTVNTLQEVLPEYDVVAPDIPVDPAEALPFLRGLCMNEVPDVVIGTSMGGMYAQQMYGYKRICVNPAFEMSKTSKVLKVGTFDYFKPRKNGTLRFSITPEIIEHYAKMEKHQFDGVTEADCNQVWGLFADGDNQVNCEPLFRKYYKQVVHFHGEHRLDDNAIKEVLAPLIREICE